MRAITSPWGDRGYRRPVTPLLTRQRPNNAGHIVLADWLFEPPLEDGGAASLSLPLSVAASAVSVAVGAATIALPLSGVILGVPVRVGAASLALPFSGAVTGAGTAVAVASMALPLGFAVTGTEAAVAVASMALPFSGATEAAQVAIASASLELPFSWAVASLPPDVVEGAAGLELPFGFIARCTVPFGPRFIVTSRRDVQGRWFGFRVEVDA